MKMQKETQQNKDIKADVLSRISSEKITPHSKMYWMCHEGSVWVLWAISVIVGALATAVIIFASLHAGFALYEVAHDSPFTFAIGVLPHIWVAVFVLMSILAYYNLRHTKSGYKYSLIHILGSSLIFSLVGGSLLHLAGVGYMLDTLAGKYAPMYRSQETMELKMWQRPDSGRLVGHLVGDVSSTTASFRDVDGVLWDLDTTDLRMPDLNTLERGHQVRVLGIYMSTSTNDFHSCGVFPWMFDKKIQLSDMQKDRRDFVERMYAHKDRAAERLSALGGEAYGEKAMGLCADMPAVRRIGESMQ